MGGVCLLVELLRVGSAPAACAVGFFYELPYSVLRFIALYFTALIPVVLIELQSECSGKV